MDPETQLLALAHTQAVARQFIAWRGDLASLIVFIRYSMGDKAPSADQLDNFLRRESTQRVLEGRYETGLWRASDKTFRLVCLAHPIDPEIAKRRLSRYPLSCNQCSFCQIDEGGRAGLDLIQELDIRREPVSPSRYLHRACQRPWNAMRALVERAESEHEP